MIPNFIGIGRVLQKIGYDKTFWLTFFLGHGVFAERVVRRGWE